MESRSCRGVGAYALSSRCDCCRCRAYELHAVNLPDFTESAWRNTHQSGKRAPIPRVCAADHRPRPAKFAQQSRKPVPWFSHGTRCARARCWPPALLMVLRCAAAAVCENSLVHHRILDIGCAIGGGGGGRKPAGPSVRRGRQGRLAPKGARGGDARRVTLLVKEVRANLNLPPTHHHRCQGSNNVDRRMLRQNDVLRALTKASTGSSLFEKMLQQH